jgi:ubiquinone/menaquinone biosynthesis C-methylase UbiE
LTAHVPDKTVDTGSLQCSDCDLEYPVIAGIPRFVPPSNYADSFGFEWHQHATTQLDSKNGTTISRDRFVHTTGWPSDLKGQTVLEVGCGSGRFTEVAFATGARLVSIDYSSAIDVAARNTETSDRLDLVQADIYSLPFKKGVFDKVLCIGVLQHTPDVDEAFRSITPLGKPGGEVVVDVYERNRLTLLNPRLYLRPITKRLPHRLLYRLIRMAVPVLLPVKSFLRRTPVIGRYLAGVIPVANYIGVYPLTSAQQREWSILDTFDIFSPQYENLRSIADVEAWLEKSNLEDVEVWNPYVSLVAGKAKFSHRNE